MIIATHDGTFHADETTACAILTYLFENTKIIRSRDPELLESADIIIDVSNINDEKHFDHHCKDFTLSRENGVKYATAGLMWKKYGHDYLKKIAKEFLSFNPSAKVIDAAFRRIDEDMMVMIDLNDNGQLTSFVGSIASPKTKNEEELTERLSTFYSASPDISYIVAMMNLPSQIGADQDKSFNHTVKILRTIIQNSAINALCTESGIAKVIDLYTGGEILMLHERLPWTSAVLNHPEIFENCKIAVYPDRNMRWRVQSLPVSKAKRFINRLSAPVEWRGLNDKDLDKVTGLNNLTFIHKSGFTGGAENYEDNLALAKLWLEKGVKPEI
ncbi:MAG: MYG1 family protein [Succinivibrio sp.]